MSTKTKLKTFGVIGFVTLKTEINIEAETFADAVEKAKALVKEDFVDILGSEWDSTYKLSGVLSQHDEL